MAADDRRTSDPELRRRVLLGLGPASVAGPSGIPAAWAVGAGLIALATLGTLRLRRPEAAPPEAAAPKPAAS